MLEKHLTKIHVYSSISGKERKEGAKKRKLIVGDDGDSQSAMARRTSNVFFLLAIVY